MTKRGTSNGNERGSSYGRRARKWWLLQTFEHPRFGAGWTWCYLCLALLSYETLTVDRIVPGCEGGRYVRGNIRPACGRCNSATGGRLAHRMKETYPVNVGEEVGMKIDDQVRLMEPRRYTRRQAAQIIGKDIDTLKRWSRDGVYCPSDSRKFGSLTVGLYTEDDIKALRQISKTMKPGRRKASA